jgi:pimeloyl-ACP methyl ester carboxylesterase
MDLFGHSASGGSALLYAAGHPRRLDHLVLACPSLRVVGIPSDLGVAEVLALRAHEQWYADAVGALYAEPASAQELARYRWLSAPFWPTSTSVRALAALFGQAELSLLPRIGHFPWVDDPVLFASTVHEFLTRPPEPA